MASSRVELSTQVSSKFANAAFTTLFFLCNLLIGPIRYIVILHYAERLSNDKHSSLMKALICYEENEVL